MKISEIEISNAFLDRSTSEIDRSKPKSADTPPNLKSTQLSGGGARLAGASIFQPLKRWVPATEVASVSKLFQAVLPAAVFVLFAAPGHAQSQAFMLEECGNNARTYFRDFGARRDMQRTDGTHAINGRIYLEARFEELACAYERSGRRMLRFFAEGCDHNAFLSRGGGDQAGPDVMRVAGVSANDVLNVRSGPGMTYQFFNPDRSFLLEQMSSDREYRGQLRQTGDHVMVVKNRCNRSQSFANLFGST